jgi:hypothetical protein
MMRFGRRASLLVALSLLASAATVSAECAWVLWTSTMPLGSVEERWGVVGVYSRESGGEAACETSADKWTKRVPQRDFERTGRAYLCLPDTIDPRGPKGK